MSSVPAAHQALQILRFLGSQGGSVPAGVIIRELALPRSSVYHLLATLADNGFVTRLADERRYALGLAAYELGTGYVRQAPLQRISRAPLATLVDRVRQSAHMSVLHGREVVYVIEERAPGRPPLVTDVGVRLPAQLTASGRAMLAQLLPAQVRALFPDPSTFVQRTGVGPRSVSALRALLLDVRRRGFAVEDGEISPGFASIASAVLDHAQYPVAGVAVTFPTTALGPAARDRIATQVVRTAAAISRRIGGNPG